MLDLGCGDGIITQHILEVDEIISATLLERFRRHVEQCEGKAEEV